MARNTERLFLSTVTIAEVQSGIAKARRTGAQRKADLLGGWLESLLHLYSFRVLAFDISAARAAGDLAEHARASGHSPGFADLAIAGTAVSNQLTVLTRNLRHFVPLGIAAHDPFEGPPSDES